MSAKKKYTFNITTELDRGLKLLKARDGIPESEALRRALTAFLSEKGVLDEPPAQLARSGKGGKTTRSK